MIEQIIDYPDSDLLRRLENLRLVAERDKQAIERGRAEYLKLVGSLMRDLPSPEAISIGFGLRLNHWINSRIDLWRRRERFSLASVMMTVMVVVALFFGGASATAYAAQSSLPGESLYEVKTFAEDIHLALVSGEKAQFNLNMDYASRRVGEFERMLAKGMQIRQKEVARLQTHLNLALQTAAEMSDENLHQALLRETIRTQSQIKTVARLQTKVQGSNVPRLAQIQTKLQNQYRLALLGIQDPQAFRQQIRYGTGPNENQRGTPGNNHGQGPVTTSEPSGASSPQGAPQGAQGTPVGPQSTPESPGGTTNSPQGSPVGPQGSPVGPQGLNNNPGGPGEPKEGPGGPGEPKEGPGGPGEPKEGPGGPGEPKEGPGGPGEPKEGPGGPGDPKEGPSGSGEPSINPKGPDPQK